MFRRISDAVLTFPRAWLSAGLAATIVLALFMEGVARVVLGGPMKPAMLICQAFGWDASLLWLGEVLHYALGLIVFPIGFVILRAIAPLGQPALAGAIWGVLLWLGASLVLAPLAGIAPFFGGGRIMMASLVAHLAYGLVLGGVYGRKLADV